MESTAFFERKIALSPRDLNSVGMGEKSSIDDLLLKKLKEKVEEKCSEHGFVLPGVKILSRSMGAFETARFTGDAVYFVKAEGKVVYPVDGLRVQGQVIRKNKMGLYVNYRDALRIQVPRDLHLGNDAFEDVTIGDTVEVQLKKSIFQINDPYILTNGLFIKKVDAAMAALSAVAAAPNVASGAGAGAVLPMASTAETGRGMGAGAGARMGGEEEKEEEEEAAAVGALLPLASGVIETKEDMPAGAEAIAAQARANQAAEVLEDEEEE